MAGGREEAGRVAVSPAVVVARDGDQRAALPQRVHERVHHDRVDTPQR